MKAVLIKQGHQPESILWKFSKFFPFVVKGFPKTGITYIYVYSKPNFAKGKGLCLIRISVDE